MIPLAVPSLDGNEAKYLAECVASTFVSSVGPFVTRLEQTVAAATGARHATATSSGTTALQLALLATGVRKHDLVIVPSFTFIATANAVSHCGATPWLLDVDERSWTLDPRQLQSVLDRETRREGDDLVHQPSGRRVAAVVPVYTLGLPADMAAITEIARSFRLKVVADGAAAIGSSYRGGAIGPLADLTALSFNGNKTITCGGGGAVVGDDPALVNHAKHLATTARVGRDYHHDVVGYNYRMTNLQAAVGCAQMERLEVFVAAKRRIRRRYDEAFADIAGLTPFPSPLWAESACWLSGVTVDDDRLPSVPSLCEALRVEGIEGRPFWKPIHLQPPYAAVPRGPLLVSDRVWSRVLTLPCSTGLRDEEQEYVIRTVRRLVGACA